MEPYVIKLAELGMQDVEVVGGKNASLGEMIGNLSNLGVSVPGGFATTAAAYREFLQANSLDSPQNRDRNNSHSGRHCDNQAPIFLFGRRFCRRV